MEASSSSTSSAAGPSPSKKRVLDESAFDPALLALDQANNTSAASAAASNKSGKNNSNSNNSNNSNSPSKSAATNKQGNTKKAPSSPKKPSATTSATTKASGTKASKAAATQAERSLTYSGVDSESEREGGDVEMEGGRGGDEKSEKLEDTSTEDAMQQQQQQTMTTPKQKSRTARGSSVATSATATPAGAATPSTVATPSPAKAKKMSATAAAQVAAATAAAAAAGAPANKGTVFTAVYSNVPVYELMARGIGVMRRRSDSWLNATQILKVAGISKAQRTKILDKDIAGSNGAIPFEKIQGGYGRYQGTWIPFHEGLKLAEQYNITEAIQPLIDYQATPLATNATLMSMSNSASMMVPPTQPAMSQGSMQGQPSSSAQQQQQHHYHHQQQQQHHAQQQQQGRPPAGSPPAQVGSINTEQAGVANLQKQKANQQMQLEQAQQAVGNLPLASATNGLPPLPPQAAPSSHHQHLPQQREQQQAEQAANASGSASVNASPSTSTAPLQSGTTTTIPRQKSGRKRTRSDLSRSTNGTDASTAGAASVHQQQQQQLSSSTGSGSVPESPAVPVKRLKMSWQRQPADLLRLHPASKPPSDPTLFNVDHRNLLMSLFIPDPSASHAAAAAQEGSSSSANAADIEPTHIIASFPEDLDPDTPIDDHLHTALHWAAALARIPTVKAIMQTGADPSRGNGLGETALMRAVLVTNNFDSETFAPPNGVEGLLSLLAPSLRTLDEASRTVLHHIALVAGIKGRSAAARHYMESILDWVINVESCAEADVRALLNARDANGDTALNIAARVGSRPIVRMLLESGADSIIPNKLGLRPGDFGILEEGLQLPTDGEMAVDDLQNTPKASASNLPHDNSDSQSVSSAHVSAQLVETLQSLLSSYAGDFKAEVASRAESLERVRNQLFIATKELKDQRAQIVSLKEQVRAVDLSKWRIKNLERALEEEDKFDWTGRSTLDGEPAFALPTKGSTDSGLDESSPAVQASAFEHRGEGSTLGALSAVNVPSSIQVDPPLPLFAAPDSGTPSPTDSKAGSSGQTQLTLVEARRMTIWYTRVIGLLRERITQTEQSAGEMELDARKVVKLCTGVQEDEEIDNMLSNLINALQSDTPHNPGGNAAGGGLDLQRVSAFMAKVRSQELS